MREIKFRAWDKDNKQMIYLDRLDITGDEVGWWDDENGFEHYAPKDALMQFTGLHDKNGKEIFEGDILRYDWVDKGEIIEVKDWYKIFWHNFSYWGKTCEVFGNKYENPELTSPRQSSLKEWK